MVPRLESGVQSAPDRMQQIKRRHGFEEHFQSLLGCAGCVILSCARVAAKEQRPALRTVLDDPGDKLKAIETGHDNVSQQQVRGFDACGLQGRQGVRESPGIVSIAAQNQCSGARDIGLVVHDKDYGSIAMIGHRL